MTVSKAADCGESQSDEGLARNSDAAGIFVLGPNTHIEAENLRRSGSLVIRTADGSLFGSVEPLIVGARPIVGFGVSVPAIHGPFRNIDVIRREKDGSISLASYVYKYR